MTTDDSPLVLGGVLGSTKRKGAWQVPARAVLKRRFGSTELDLTQAVFAATELTFEVDLVGGSIELRVPADMHVESEVQTTLASYEDHRKVNPVPGARTLTLTGRAVFGSVEVR